ncbi:MAG: hypothetical protein D6714_17735 [Bacteroidetes bacterium]|nr:MAG: hypothetical protein D6714_17735 [Bacteroidota bacterium]
MKTRRPGGRKSIAERRLKQKTTRTSGGCKTPDNRDDQIIRLFILHHFYGQSFFYNTKNAFFWDTSARKTV